MLKLGVPVPDSVAPVASVHCGRGTRSGLLSVPVGVTCSRSTVLVLQSTPDQPQGCIAAFDLSGNPVACFGGGLSVAPLRHEDAVRTVVLDISVESKGYIYVLKYLSSGSEVVSAADYRLDIYNPDGSFLTQVAGLAAARLQVDLWRNIYTLNYEILEGSGRTEPSIAFWVPSTP